MNIFESTFEKHKKLMLESLTEKTTNINSWKSYSKVTDEERKRIDDLKDYPVELDRYVKSLWNKYVDRNFIQSLILVHWTSMENVTKIKNGKAELSTEAYLNFPIKRRFTTNIDETKVVGMKIEGRVTFAANTNLNSWKSTSQDEMNVYARSGRKYAGIHWLSNIIFDKNTFKTDGTMNNEVFVGNWKLKALIVDISEQGTENKIKFIKENFETIPLLGVDGKPINNI